MSYSYDNVYGVQLLDDIHNYFPDILYNHDRFRNVHDLLRYISNSTRRQFNLFNVGRNRYRESRQENEIVNPPQSNPIGSAVNPDNTDEETVPVTPSRQPSTASAHGGSPLPSEPRTRRGVTAPPVRIRTEVRTVHPTTIYEPYILQMPLGDDFLGDAGSSSLLSGLATLLGTSMPRGFMNPVEVRPSSEEIARSTRVYRRLVQSTGDEEDICPICQESMNISDELREITHCHHSFHKGCIDTWLIRNVHCPVCRHDIREVGPSSNQQGTTMDEDNKTDDL